MDRWTITRQIVIYKVQNDLDLKHPGDPRGSSASGLGTFQTDQCFLRTFMTEAEEIAVSRRMNSLTLNRHTEILEILEIPQLMDTCVRNGYYEEALELAAYVRRLERKHAALPVIQVRVGCGLQACWRTEACPPAA